MGWWWLRAEVELSWCPRISIRRSLEMQVHEGIGLVVLYSLGDDVMPASTPHVAVAHVGIDHCHLPHHGHLFGTVGHRTHSVGHLGKISAVYATVFADAGDRAKTANAAATGRFLIVVPLGLERVGQL